MTISFYWRRGGQYISSISSWSAITAMQMADDAHLTYPCYIWKVHP